MTTTTNTTGDHAMTEHPLTNTVTQVQQRTESYNAHEVLATETYRGVELEVRSYPAWSDGRSSRGAYITPAFDGETYRAPRNLDEVKALKWARKAVDAMRHDDELYPALEAALLGYAAGTNGAEVTSADELELGAIVQVYSRGTLRPAVVDGITRTGRVTCAYITRGGLDEAAKYRGPGAQAQITRKTVPATELKLLTKAGA